MNKTFSITLAAFCIGLACAAFAGDGGHGADAGEQQQAVHPLPEPPAAQIAEREAAQDSKGEPKKIIVARVNGTGITMQSLTNVMNRLSARKGTAAGTPQGKESLRKEVLDRLIFGELAYQKATAEGLRADPADVDKAVESLKMSMGGPEGLNEQLEKDGVTMEELRSDIARGLVIERIFKREVSNKVTVSDDELKRAYEKEKDKFLLPEKMVVIDIIFFLDPEEDASVQKAEKVLRMIQEDKNKDPISLVPDGTFMVKELELNKKKDKGLFEQAKKLKPGEFSGVIKTSGSLHILQLKEYSPERQFALEDVKGQLAAQIGAEARLKRMREWEKELRNRATVEILDTGESKQSPVKSE